MVGTAAKAAERTKTGAGSGVANGRPDACRTWVSAIVLDAFGSLARYCRTMPAAWARPGCAGGSRDQPASAGVASIRIFSWRIVCSSIGIQYSITPKPCQKFPSLMGAEGRGCRNPRQSNVLRTRRRLIFLLFTFVRRTYSCRGFLHPRFQFPYPRQVATVARGFYDKQTMKAMKLREQWPRHFRIGSNISFPAPLRYIANVKPQLEPDMTVGLSAFNIGRLSVEPYCRRN